MRGQEYEVLVVDTAGQDEYSIFPTQYSVDIDGFILVYSIDSEKSFEVVQASMKLPASSSLGSPIFRSYRIFFRNETKLNRNRFASNRESKKIFFTSFCFTFWHKFFRFGSDFSLFRLESNLRRF